MKANETPEKIYIPSDLDWQTETCIMNKRNVDDVEYIRTDAFIEKACSILKDISCQFEIIEQFKNKIR